MTPEVEPVLDQLARRLAVPLLLNNLDAAAYVGLSPATWERVKSTGALPRPRRVVTGRGIQLLYRRKDLDEYVDKLKADDTNLPKCRRTTLTPEGE